MESDTAIKRIILAIILVSVNALPTAFLGLTLFEYINPVGFDVQVPLPNERAVIPKLREMNTYYPAIDLIIALAVVIVIFLLTLLVLWALSKIGGPLKAEVKASIEKFGGKIWITAAGLVGAFLAIAITGVVSVYALSRL